jgi:hypothetical protein
VLVSRLKRIPFYDKSYFLALSITHYESFTGKLGNSVSAAAGLLKEFWVKKPSFR